jgi:hypothetical protein
MADENVWEELRRTIDESKRDREQRRVLGSLLRCVECERTDDGRRGWTLRLTVDDELAAFCPVCDHKEFSDDGCEEGHA